MVPASDAAAAEALMHGVPIRDAQDLIGSGGKVPHPALESRCTWLEPMRDMLASCSA